MIPKKFWEETFVPNTYVECFLTMDRPTLCCSIAAMQCDVAARQSSLIIEHELQHVPKWGLKVVDQREAEIIEFVLRRWKA